MAKGDKICVCPKCGGDIVETEKAYSCSNWRESDGNCKVTVWKTTSGREITQDEAKTLIENGETAILDGFVSKAGKPFSAKLVIESDGKAKFQFPSNN